MIASLSPMARAWLRAGRRRIALERIKARGERALRAPLLGGQLTVLVHRSTKRRGWWQATFFDAEGEPYGDSEAERWADLLDHIHGDSVDWCAPEEVAR